MSVSVEKAVEYWGKRLYGETFTRQSRARQEQALQSALDSIAQYIQGIPETDAEAAIYEQAHWLLGSRAELQSQGVSSFSLSGISESYSVNGRPAAVAPNAWRIIKYGVDGSRRGGGVAWLL